MPANQGTTLILDPGAPQQGNPPTQAMDKYGVAALAAAHDQFYQQTVQGNMFQLSTNSAVPITSTTAPNLNLWNPSDSGVNLVLVRYLAGLSSTPDVATDILLMGATSAGSTIATGAAYTAFTLVTPVNGLFGKGKTSKARCAVTATVTAAFFTAMTSLGLSNLATTAAQLNTPWFTGDIWFRGTVILPPGTAIFDAGTAATGATHRRSLYWYEAPLA